VKTKQEIENTSLSFGIIATTTTIIIINSNTILPNNFTNNGALAALAQIATLRSK
jgi:hypothetical protein